MADTTHISWADMTFNPWVGRLEASGAEPPSTLFERAA